MWLLQLCAFALWAATLGQAYSKYGRSCKDIGCLSNEVCVMETDPCSYYQRQNECGSYPTCKKNQNSGAPSCKNYVCPPTKVCKLDGNTPKCVDDHSKVNQVGYDTSALNNPADQAQGGNLYPSIPRGETTPRPNAPQQPYGQGGYQGGQVGSGYPGQARPGSNPQQGYPSQPRPGSIPQQPPYQGGYYPQQGGYGGYPQQPSGNYPNYYQNGGYNPYPYQQNGYNQPPKSSSSGGIGDSIKDALTKYGLFYAFAVVFVYQGRIWGV